MRSSLVLVWFLFCLQISINAWGVFGGQALSVETQKVVVRIQPQRDLGKSVVCSAVILSDNIIVTAAHCTEDYEFAGPLTITEPQTSSININRIKSVARHPRYKLGFKNQPTLDQVGNDIAVVKLSRSISFSHGVAPLPEFAEFNLPTRAFDRQRAE